MQININDGDLNGFNTKAKDKLIESTTEFINNLIEESNRLEASHNNTSNEPEITSSMVNDACVLLRRGLSQPRKNIGIKILRILSAILSMLVGFLYDPIKLQNGAYMFVFIFIITIAIIIVTISTIKE